MKDYDHYIGLDWAQQNMAIARMTNFSDEVQTIDVRTDIEDLKAYLENLKGRKILTFEETNPAQWLYTELRPYVDRILVCDPYRNHLLKEGGKSDRVDARKLAKLLKGELLKEVFHCTDDFIKIRKIMSGYADLIQMGVRQKNQRKALFRACGKKATKDKLDDYNEIFVLNGLEAGIVFYEEQKLRYAAEFKRIAKHHEVVQNLMSIPGLGPVGSILVAAIVVDPSRFQKKQQFWSYCGLIRHELMSGGRSYGQRRPRYSRRLKSVFKTAAIASIANKSEQNPFYVFYQNLIIKKRYPEFQARHALARRIATLAFGVMKSNKKLNTKDLLEKEMN